MKIFAKIRFYLGALFISSTVALIMIPALFVAPKFSCQILHYLNAFILFVLGGKIEEEGTMDPEVDMVLINHQGIIDIIAMESRDCTGLRWVAKKELFDTLWFGNVVKRSDMISIDRENKTGLIKLIRDSKETIESKKRIVTIFPEGTRASGQKLLPFKAGARLIANKLKLKVQPVVIVGSKKLLNEHNRTAHSSTVKIIFLDSIDTTTAEKDWYVKLAEDMQKTIDKEFNEHKIER